MKSPMDVNGLVIGKPNVGTYAEERVEAMIIDGWVKAVVEIDNWRLDVMIRVLMDERKQ